MARSFASPQGSDPLDRDEIVANASFVRGVARDLLADTAAADDLAQETLLKLLKAARARPLRPASLKAWLARVVKNLAIQWRLADVRRATREESSARREAIPATAALVQRIELHRRVVDAALALEEPQRTVVLLHYFDGHSMAEVAQRLAIPLETARTRLKRALERLRAHLEPELGGRQALLLALLPVAGFELSAAPIAAGGGSLAAPLQAPLVVTTIGKLAIAAAPLLAVGAWWLLHGVSLVHAETPGEPVAIERRHPTIPPVPRDLAPADAARYAEAPAAASESASAIDAALAAQGLGTVRVHVFTGPTHAIAAGVGVRVVPEAEPDSIADAVRGSTNGEGLFVAERVRAGWCAAAIAGFPTLPSWRWEHPEASGSGDDRKETPPGHLSIGFKLAPGATRDVELVVPDGRQVEGRVVDANDRPIAGASILLSDVETTPVYGEHGSLNGESSRAGINGQVVATTDSQGRFELQWINRCCLIAAFCPGYAVSQGHGTGMLRGPRCALTIRLDRAGTTVTGVVVDGGGEAVANAVVSIALEEMPPRVFEDGVVRYDPPARRERTGSDGRFAIDGAPLARARLVVVAAGFAPGSREITPSPSASNDFVMTLESGGTLFGTARDESGAPVVAAEIEVQPADFVVQRNVDSIGTKTDARGDFRIEHLPIGELRASIVDGHGGRDATSFTIRSSETTPWNPVVTRGRVLRGRVVDERGAPLCRWEVGAVALADPGAREREVLARSDRDGRFEFTDCADVDYELSARAPYATQFVLGAKLAGHPGGGELLLQVLDRELSKSWIFGSIRVPDGFSTADALFDVTRLDGTGSSTTMASITPARFQSGPYPAGRYALALRIGRLPHRDLGVHELEPGHELDLGEIVYERPASVVVRARHADGSAVDPKELVVVARDSPESIDVTPSGEGLVAGPLEPGRYLLRSASSAAGCVWRPFRCSAGQTVELAMTLEAGALRSFRFVGRGGAQTPDRLVIRCFDESGDEVWSQTLSADERGVLELRARLPIGRWTLEAAASDGSRAEFEIDVAKPEDDAAERTIALRR